MLVACLVFVLTRMPETLGLTPQEVATDVRAMWGGAGDWQELEMHEMQVTKQPRFSLGLWAIYIRATFVHSYTTLPLKHLPMMLRPSPHAHLRPNHPSKH